jgi:GGDEF domain-containing protein
MDDITKGKISSHFENIREKITFTSTGNSNAMAIDPELKEKCEIIYKVVSKQAPPPDTSDLPPSIAAKINDLPLSDRSEVLQNAADDLKRQRATESEKMSLMYWLNILRKNYYERTKTYLIPDKINTQAYLFSKLEEEIHYMCKKRNLDVMCGRIGWAFLDTNALKGTNDVFGHDKGNVVIRKIAKRLKSLQRIKTKNGGRVKLQCAIQSGDEYNLLLSSNVEIKPLISDICEQIHQYINTTKTTGVLDFSSRTEEEKVRILNELKENGIDLNDRSQNNRFILSTSCGISTLEEVIREIQIKEDDTFITLFGKIKHYLETKAENRAIRSKKETKERVGSMNPLMRYLLSFRK